MTAKEGVITIMRVKIPRKFTVEFLWDELAGACVLGRVGHSMQIIDEALRRSSVVLFS